MYKPFLCVFYELMIVPHNVKERKNSGKYFSIFKPQQSFD